MALDNIAIVISVVQCLLDSRPIGSSASHLSFKLVLVSNLIVLVGRLICFDSFDFDLCKLINLCLRCYFLGYVSL